MRGRLPTLSADEPVEEIAIRLSKPPLGEQDQNGRDGDAKYETRGKGESIWPEERFACFHGRAVYMIKLADATKTENALLWR